MPRDTHNSFTPPTPSSPYPDAQLRRSNRLRQNASTPSGSSAAAGSSSNLASSLDSPTFHQLETSSTPSRPRPQCGIPTPLTPSTPRVVKTYSRASKKKHGKGKGKGKQRRESSVDSILSNESEDLPTVLEFLEQLGRPSQSVPDAVILKELQTSVEFSGSCTICMQPMDKPYITSCGHGWCAGCLQRTFQAQLKAKLSDFVFISHSRLNHTLVECQYIPTSDFDQRLLVKALKEHDCNLEEVFTYACPECRAPVKTEPVVNYPLLHFLDSQRKPLKGRIHRVDRPTLAPLYPFQGLFM